MLFLLTIVTMTAAAICEASERLTKLLNELLEDHEAEDLELESQQVRQLDFHSKPKRQESSNEVDRISHIFRFIGT